MRFFCGFVFCFIFLTTAAARESHDVSPIDQLRMMFWKNSMARDPNQEQNYFLQKWIGLLKSEKSSDREKLRILIHQIHPADWNVSYFLALQKITWLISEEFQDPSFSLIPREQIQNLNLDSLPSALPSCWMLAGPGDFILRNAYNDPDVESDFGSTLRLGMKILEISKFSDIDLDFRHAELITAFDTPWDLQGLSFYPPLFQRGHPVEEQKPKFLKIDNSSLDYTEYRNRFSIFRPKSRAARELAILKAKDPATFSGIGTCADFINWLYGGEIMSWWNVMPGVRRLLEKIYPPEWIQTPDDLADSNQVELVCTVRAGQLQYPKLLPTQNLMLDLQSRKNSKSREIRTHAIQVENWLEKTQNHFQTHQWVLFPQSN